MQEIEGFPGFEDVSALIPALVRQLTPGNSAMYLIGNWVRTTFVDVGARVPKVQEAHFECRVIGVAAASGYHLVTKMLLLAGASANWYYGGKTLLIAAAENGHEFTVRILLDAGGEIHIVKLPEVRQALHAAAQGGHDSTVQLLLDRGASIDVKDEERDTALQWAEIDMVLRLHYSSIEERI